MFRSILLGALVAYASTVTAAPADEIRCLADNVYHESRGEPRNGQLAVAHVTINRAKASGFPDSICAVVNQRNARGCQFSWVCNGKTTVRSSTTYREIIHLAAEVYRSRIIFRQPDRVTWGALYFHNSTVDPGWSDTMRRTTTIGQHQFYAERRSSRG